MSLLGRLSPSTFLREYWHRRPLLIRQALPGFRGIVDREALVGLAMGNSISRLVIERPGRRSRWERHDGPFLHVDVERLPRARWTLLVHGIESLVQGGWELLRELSFIPAARVDDLMVSYAAPAGSVGPHDDLYDVFLLQGPGRRRWQISRGGDRTCDETAAIKVLKSFVPDEEWLLEPGDMLYLPPGVAHWGVAEEACFTYSIGFLAPSHLDLMQSFLGYLGGALQAAVDPDALVESVRLKRTNDPLAIEDAMVKEVAGVMEGIRWDKALIAQFLGCFLTRPKPHVSFAAPARPLTEQAFARRLRGHGRLELALQTRGLVRRGQLFLNGEAHAANRAVLSLFKELVYERSVPLPLSINENELLYAWYLAGYLGFTSRAKFRS
jgi:50S ribosomal protein L16 3-hydroxylase